MAAEKTSFTEAELSDFQLDSQNFNEGTERGSFAIERSMREYGFARPIVAAADGTIIAGNHAFQTAEKIGIKKVRYIETSGDEIIVHKRTDLDSNDPRARMLALADNRTAELNLQWDTSGLAEFAKGSEEVNEFFSTSELELLADALNPPAYEPVLQPNQGTANVSDADVEKTKNQMDGKFVDAGSQDIVDITCPHCSASFGISKLSLVS